MSNKQREKQSYDVVNLLKESIDQDSPEINSDCGQEHMKRKFSLSVEKNLMQKRERIVFPEVVYSEILWGGRNSLWTTPYALHFKSCLGQT